MQSRVTIIGESPHEWQKKIVIHANPYVILFLTHSYSVCNTGRWWKLSSTHSLVAIGLSITVFWRNTSMYFDVILTHCHQNVSKDARSFSRGCQVDYHSLIIDRRYHRLACKKPNSTAGWILTNHVGDFHSNDIIIVHFRNISGHMVKKFR